MIVSYINRLKSATLSATNEDINQPVTNIIHNFLELPFYCTDDNSIITALFNVDYDINHIAFDYHNIDTMTLRFYDVLDVLLDTIIITVEENCNFFTFDTIENVNSIEIDIVNNTSEFLYVGGISMGAYLEFPRFRQTLDGEIQIIDSSFISGGGQASGNKKRNLDAYNLNFANITNTERQAIKTYLDYVQTSIPHFIDFYEDDHINWAPFYGVQIKKMVPLPKRRISTWMFNFSLTYQEVR